MRSFWSFGDSRRTSEPARVAFFLSAPKMLDRQQLAPMDDIYIYIYIDRYRYRYVYLSIYLSLSLSLWLYIYTCIYIYIYIHNYICIRAISEFAAAFFGARLESIINSASGRGLQRLDFLEIPDIPRCWSARQTNLSLSLYIYIYIYT